MLQVQLRLELPIPEHDAELPARLEAVLKTYERITRNGRARVTAMRSHHLRKLARRVTA